MKVFISWSGERSKAFRGLLPADPSKSQLKALDALLSQLRHEAANKMYRVLLLEEKEALSQEEQNTHTGQGEEGDDS
ncbi:MAG TPA: hypothetical protein VGJ69_05740 [Pyrinomonadaceae bacterium]|jgi:Spy/CpxP family protein refolding chaperone